MGMSSTSGAVRVPVLRVRETTYLGVPSPAEI